MYQNKAMVWYGHACKRGSDSMISADLYSGTAKSVEGYLVGILLVRQKRGAMLK